MNEIIGAWVNGHANGHGGGSHDFWFIFLPGGRGRFVYSGWWLYHFDTFRWHACPSANTFRILHIETRYQDPIGPGSQFPSSSLVGFHSYTLREGAGSAAPSLVLTIPGLPAESEFLLQTNQPLQMASRTEASDWR